MEHMRMLGICNLFRWEVFLFWVYYSIAEVNKKTREQAHAKIKCDIYFSALDIICVSESVLNAIQALRL